MRSCIRAAAMSAAAVAMMACSTSWAGDLDWPTRQVTIVVAQAAGSSADTSARMLATVLGPMWKQPVVVVNKPGADGVIGINYVVRSPPDGYTLGYAAPSNMTINPFLYKMPFNPLEDLMPVSQLTDLPFALVVNPKLPIKTVKDLVEYVKSRKGDVNFSSAGVGNAGHLSAELLMMRAGIKMHHIPNKGDSPGLMDVASGTTDLMFVPLPGANPSIKSGLVRLIAVTTKNRVAAYPDIPTVEQAGYPGVVVDGWGGYVAPIGTPPEVIAKIQQSMHEALSSPEIVKYLASNGSLPVGSTPEEFKTFLQAESQKWSGVIKTIGLGPAK